MKRYLSLAASGVACGVLLAACNDGSTTVPTAPPTPTQVGFEAFAQNLVELNTCETTAPANTNGVDFQYASDQDMAEPRDVSAVTAACSSS